MDVGGNDRPAGVWRDDDALEKGKYCSDNSEQLVWSVAPVCLPRVMLGLSRTNFNQVSTADTKQLVPMLIASVTTRLTWDR